MSMKFGGVASRCVCCEGRVYKLEELQVDKAILHKACFKCTHCKRQLTLSNFAAVSNKFYCKTHFIELFHSSGGKYSVFGNDTFKHKESGSFNPTQTPSGSFKAARIASSSSTTAKNKLQFAKKKVPIEAKPAEAAAPLQSANMVFKADNDCRDDSPQRQQGKYLSLKERMQQYEKVASKSRDFSDGDSSDDDNVKSSSPLRSPLRSRSKSPPVLACASEPAVAASTPPKATNKLPSQFAQEEAKSVTDGSDSEDAAEEDDLISSSLPRSGSILHELSANSAPIKEEEEEDAEDSEFEDEENADTNSVATNSLPELIPRVKTSSGKGLSTTTALHAPASPAGNILAVDDSLPDDTESLKKQLTESKALNRKLELRAETLQEENERLHAQVNTLRKELALQTAKGLEADEWCVKLSKDIEQLKASSANKVLSV